MKTHFLLMVSDEPSTDKSEIALAASSAAPSIGDIALAFVWLARNK